MSLITELKRRKIRDSCPNSKVPGAVGVLPGKADHPGNLGLQANPSCGEIDR